MSIEHRFFIVIAILIFKYKLFGMFYVTKMSHYNLQPFVTCLVLHLIWTIVLTFV
jgi:hypothetical protein